jgi:hypothetical protein
MFISMYSLLLLLYPPPYLAWSTAAGPPIVAQPTSAVRVAYPSPEGAAQVVMAKRNPPAAPVARDGPPNDACVDAVPVMLRDGVPVTVTGDNTGATRDCEYAPYTGSDIWYLLTVPEKMDVSIRYCGTAPAFGSVCVFLYTTCDCERMPTFATNFETDSCGDGNWSVYWDNLLPGDYFFPVRGEEDSTGPFVLMFTGTVRRGACCQELECIGTISQAACDDAGATWYPGQTCETFACPPDTCATAFFNNGSPDYANYFVCQRGGSVDPDAWIVDDIVVGAPTVATDVHWMASLTPDFGQPATADLIVLADNASRPGDVIAELSDLPVESYVTAEAPFGEPLWVFEIHGLELSLSAGFYWIGMRPVCSTGSGLSYWFTAPPNDTGDIYIKTPIYGAPDWTSSVMLWGMHYNVNFCLVGQQGSPATGACCNEHGECTEVVPLLDCLPPRRFLADGQCEQLDPPCLNSGACCDNGLECAFTGPWQDCEAINGFWYMGEDCSTFACPAICHHRVELRDVAGDGWNSSTLDVYVDDQLVLDNITLSYEEGSGPVSYYFVAPEGSTIRTVFNVVGGWSWDCSYAVYDGHDVLLGQDGAPWYPTGLTLTARCNIPTEGACCFPDGSCMQAASEEDCAEGNWLGLGGRCVDCPSPYCDASGDCSFESIAYVEMGSIAQESDCHYYQNFLEDSTDVALGVPETLFVVSGYPVAWSFCTVWVDWNHDYEFGPDEQVGLTDGGGPYILTIQPPLDAALGPTRMRIRVGRDTEPCDLYWYGEVEDYTLNVISVPGACCYADGTCQETLLADCTESWGGSYTACSHEDCNGNGVDDFCDLVTGTSTDCNANGILDDCEPWSDCDGNGVFDACDLISGAASDCNWNGIPDACDIASGDSTDCQGNGVPDECELGAYDFFAADDGSSENSLGPNDGGEMCWLQHLTAAEELDVATVYVCFGTPWYAEYTLVEPGTPVRVYVWSDPDGDGAPQDAVLLAEATAPIEAYSINTDEMQPIPIRATVSGSFFVGASVQTGPGAHPASMDQLGGTLAHESWFTDNTVPFDPTSLLPDRIFTLDDIYCPGNWLLEVELQKGADCNGNQVPDDCDIASGISEDANGNGVPDECELLLGDVNCDGTVDAFDIDPFVMALVDPDAFQAAYPACSLSHADINGDGAVNAFDIDAFVQCLTVGCGPGR